MSSYSATLGSRNRGKQTRGGKVELNWVTPGNEPSPTLVLEDWELRRLLRLLPVTLHGALSSSATARDQQTAADIADILGAGHPAYAFFAGATGGFTVERA